MREYDCSMTVSKLGCMPRLAKKFGLLLDELFFGLLQSSYVAFRHE